MKRLLFLFLTLLVFVGHVRATDVSIAATTINGFSPANIGNDVSVSVSATSGSPTVTSSAAFRSNWVGLGGFRIVIGGTVYTVSYVTSTSSLTLTGNYTGSTGSAVATFYRWVEMRIYSDRSFQPLGASYMVQPGTPGSGAVYKRFAASIVNVAGVDVLYIPAITLDATTDAAANNTARYTVGFYNSGTLIQYYDCNGTRQLAIPPTTPTSWTDICSYNAAPAFVVDQSSYTKPQIDARFPSCSSGQMLYFAATGQKISCLTVGSNLSISNGTISATGGGGGSGTVSSGTANTVAGYLTTGTTVSSLSLGTTLTVASGTLKNIGVHQATNVLDYNADPSGVANSTTAIVNWITACQASGSRACYLPGGTYLTDPITLSLNGLRIVGDGREKSILKARVANAPVVAITGANYFVNVTIDGIGFEGQGKSSGSSGHCVSISDSTGGSAQFEIRNAGFTNCGGKGLYIPYMFAGRFRNLIFDEIGDNHMEIQGGSATIIEGVDFKTLEAGKIALWIYSGNPVLIGNNGIEPDSGASTIWGRFGRSSADGDGADSYVLGASFIGNNVEDFKGTGWQFRTGSGGATYSGNTFISPSSGTVTAIYYQFLSGTELGIWSGGTFTLQGTAAWTNSQPVHARGFAPFYVSGTNTPANFYEWNAAETRTLPYVRPKLLAGTTKNGLQVSEAILDAVYDSNLAGTLTGTTDPSGNASRVLLQNGSASRPVFGSSVDSTTGAYFGTNTIGFTVGGTSRATLTNSAFLPTVKTTFSPTASVAGVNVGSVSGDPSAPANGDLWYDSTGNLLRARINGSTISLGAGGGGSMSIGGTVTSGTAGSVLFVNSGPVLAQDNTNFYWDDTNNRLSLGGIGTSPATPLHVLADASNLGVRVKANAAAINVDLSSDGSVGFLGTTTNHPLELWTNSTTRVRIEAGGLVGINDATPGAQLDVTANGTGTVGAIVNGASGATADLVKLQINGTDIIRFVPVSGDVNTVLSDSALATTATDGFVYFPSMAGVPSGVPTGYTGTIPLVVDSTNSRLYGRIGGSWVNLSGGGGSGITIGTTTITSGTDTRVLYNNAGVVGEYAVTGTGNAVLSASPTFTGRVSAADGLFATSVSTGTGATAGLQVTANSLTTGNGAEFSSSSVSSGNVVSIAATGTAAASNSKHALLVSTSGANATSGQTTYGAEITNTSTGTSSTNIGLGLSASGGTTNNALSISAGRLAFTAAGAFNAQHFIFTNPSPNQSLYVDSNSWIWRNESTGGIFQINWAAKTVFTASDFQLGFSSSSSTSAGAADTAFARAAAAVIRATNGSTGIGSVLIGTSTDSVTGNFTVMASNAATNSIVDIARLGVNSTGTAAVGFGGRLSLSLESSTTNDQVAALQSWAWTDATHASRTSYLAWSIVNSATTTEMLRLDPNGLRIPEIASAATPAANNVYLYAKDKTGVSTLYYKKDDGTEVEIGSGGGGSPGGSNTQVQFNNAGSFGGISGLTTNGSTTLVQTSSSAAAFESGPNGSTNPVFRLVNNIASAATGLSITGNAAGSGVTLTALSSGTNEDIVINPKGTGAIQIGTGPFARFDSGHNSNFTASTGVLKLGNDLWLSSNLAAVGLNAYYNGANFIYAQTDPAFLFGFNSNRNAFKIQAAASGTAGNTITFSAGLAVLSDATVGVNKESSTGAQFHAVSGSSSRVALRADSASSNTVDIAQFTVNGSTTAGDFVGLASGGAVKVRRQTYSGSGTQTLNLANGTVHELTVTGTTTIALSNIQNGGMYIIAVIQDATGGRSVTLPSTIKLPGGSWIFTTTANARDEFHCYSDGTNLYCMPQADVK